MLNSVTARVTGMQQSLQKQQASLDEYRDRLSASEERSNAAAKAITEMVRRSDALDLEHRCREDSRRERRMLEIALFQKFDSTFGKSIRSRCDTLEHALKCLSAQMEDHILVSRAEFECLKERLFAVESIKPVVEFTMETGKGKRNGNGTEKEKEKEKEKETEQGQEGKKEQDDGTVSTDVLDGIVVPTPTTIHETYEKGDGNENERDERNERNERDEKDESDHASL
eukprot:692589-Pelagomonas_calceolata.AAC.1